MSASSRRYDLVSSAYGVIADAAEHGARESGLTLLAARVGERVLEVGCGTGRALAALADAAAGGGLVCGLDQSAGMLGLAQPQRGAAPIYLQRGNALCLPYLSGQFDAAFMSFTLELFTPAEIPVVLSEIRRVLKPHGRLGIVSLSFEHTLPVDAYRWLHRHFPLWIDCQPIEVLNVLAGNRYRTLRTCRLEVWKLPVVVAVATPVGA